MKCIRRKSNAFKFPLQVKIPAGVAHSNVSWGKRSALALFPRMTVVKVPWIMRRPSLALILCICAYVGSDGCCECWGSGFGQWHLCGRRWA